ncbi:MAG: ParB/RepB/Spo0J family partition protein [Muribaculaceae bacterium]|nr:ParB/RepB/Spo0J family partition protein [Muribaculaceae bacterium]
MEVQQIPIGRIQPSPMNPRKTFGQDDLEELAANIKEQGLLQPITVRPVESTDSDPLADGCYEIVCGERRYRAMCIIGDEDYKVPCIVRIMSDEEAFDAMITENLQRKDVDPMEEAFAFGQLANRGQSTEEIALRFGKTQRFVLDRIKLNKLIPELMMRVKDGEMAISAALIICKLDEEEQRKFYERHTNYGSIGKDTAVRFCNGVFQFIRNSAWAQDEREDFDGGCGKRCAECEFNTINAGCLFYEMKSDDSTARCTNKDKFLDKKLAYMMSIIDAHADNIVKVDEPLEAGKIAVVADIGDYCQDRAEAERFIANVKAKGYEVFNRNDIFGAYSYYDPDDERLQEKLANNEVYRCLNISSYYSGVEVNERYYQIKKDLEGVDNAELKESAEALKVAEKYKKAAAKCRFNRATSICKLFGFSAAKLNTEPLSDIELDVLAAYMLRHSDYTMRYAMLGSSVQPPVDVCFDFVTKNRDKRDCIIRDYLRKFVSVIDESSGCKAQTAIANAWYPEKLKEIEESFAAEFEKKTGKIAKQLNDMGYDTEGKKIEK